MLVACSGRPGAPVCVGGATLDGGRCVSQRAPAHHLPFRDGFQTRVMQGFHGYMSHKEDLAYSVDFKCEEGAAVAASRNGVVWAVKEDSDTGCADPACMDQANYVILDHGDGTYSEYYHLRHLGVLVEEGDPVCSGQVIGICGNTGYSTGAHLHFALTDLTRRTVPVQFDEARRQQRFGFPLPNASLVSTNRMKSRCRETEYSRMGRDAFAHHGIILRDELPTVITDRTATRVRGRFYGDHARVAIHRKRSGGAAWLDQCVEVDDDGDFEFDISWPLDRFGSGTYWFMLTGAGEECLAPGWAWSYKVRVR